MSGWNKPRAISERELREALALAHKALSEIAQATGLHPDAERARDMCGDALKKLGNGARHSRSH